VTSGFTGISPRAAAASSSVFWCGAPPLARALPRLALRRGGKLLVGYHDRDVAGSAVEPDAPMVDINAIDDHARQFDAGSVGPWVVGLGLRHRRFDFGKSETRRIGQNRLAFSRVHRGDPPEGKANALSVM
jgi:hypothetical protein